MGTTRTADRKGSHPAADETVAVTINGAGRRLSGSTSIAQLLSSLSLDPRAVVVEHNGAILRDRQSLASIALAEGDTVEIVHFVGGG